MNLDAPEYRYLKQQGLGYRDLESGHNPAETEK
jgi:hypothetical protein